MIKTFKLLLVCVIPVALISLGCPTEPEEKPEPEPEPITHTVKKIAPKTYAVNAIPDFTLDLSGVSAFLGGKDYKLALCRNYRLYIVTSLGGNVEVIDIAQDDEAYTGLRGRPNSPLFSPDGNFVAYTGASISKTISFMCQLKVGADSLWRVPIINESHWTAEPHWYRTDDGKLWLFAADSGGSVKYDTLNRRLPGNTYRYEFINDSTIGPEMATDLPGAFKGGLSKDGKWALTSYATTLLYDRISASMIPFIYSGRMIQNCNPSINPFPAGSARTDYSMFLGFGNYRERDSTYKSIVTVTDSALYEGQHENIWIYNKDKKVVWQCPLSDRTKYVKWEKPEWSNHPNYATSVQVSRADEKEGDLYIIKIGDLANNDELSLKQPEAIHKVGSGFGASDWTHLWVAE